MKKGYRITSNGKYYKVQRFYSFLSGLFKFVKTVGGCYDSYDYAEEMMVKIRELKAAEEKIKRDEKERKKGLWKVVETFFN